MKKLTKNQIREMIEYIVEAIDDDFLSTLGNKATRAAAKAAALADIRAEKGEKIKPLTHNGKEIYDNIRNQHGYLSARERFKADYGNNPNVAELANIWQFSPITVDQNMKQVMAVPVVVSVFDKLSGEYVRRRRYRLVVAFKCLANKGEKMDYSLEFELETTKTFLRKDIENSVGGGVLLSKLISDGKLLMSASPVVMERVKGENDKATVEKPAMWTLSAPRKGLVEGYTSSPLITTFDDNAFRIETRKDFEKAFGDGMEIAEKALQALKSNTKIEFI